MLGHWMGAERTVRIALVALIATVTLVSVLASASLAAGAEAPVWRIISTAEPTTLEAPQNEVQEIKVKATGGLVVAHIQGHNDVFFFSATAGHDEVQAAIEAQVGAGNVEVSGGPGDAEGTKPYVVTFTGSLAAQEIPLMFVNGLFESESESVAVHVAQVGGSGGELVVTAINVGGAATDGSTITIHDSLPTGLTATSISGEESYHAGNAFAENPQAKLNCPKGTLTCTYSHPVDPGDTLVVRIPVTVQSGAPSSVVNSVTVSGGGAEDGGASVSRPLAIGSTEVGFGIAPGSVLVADSTRQAGAHANVTTGFTMNTTSVHHVSENPKDIRFDLPPGQVGNTVGMATCPAAKAFSQECPRDTVVGIATVFAEANNPLVQVTRAIVAPVFNITPSPGEPVAFMFKPAFIPVRLDTSVLSNGDYGVRVTAGNLSQAAEIISTYVTIWGVPADHNGPGNIGSNYSVTATAEDGHSLGGPNLAATRVPLLSNPTQCLTPLTATMETDPWLDRDVFQSAQAPIGTLIGCNLLTEEPSMSMLPDTLQAGAPAGYSFGLHVPQVNDPDGLAAPNVQKVVTALPVGAVISPSAAWGLAACSDAQFFGPSSERGLERPAKPAGCPREAQVGTVLIQTPALALPLTGDVFLASPQCGPCTPQDAQDAKMVRLFLQVIGEGNSGIVVKLEGTGRLDQQTGQLTVTFDRNPQLPFSDLKLTLGGGPRATLANPRACGPATTALSLTPWSTPFTNDLASLYTFNVTGCYSPQFDPSFVAGTTSIQSGEYTPFMLSFGRKDADQFLGGLQLRMPPGLLGKVSTVTLCKEPQAAQGECPAESLIGHVQVLTGPGQTPFLVTGGQVFLTESYKGAPFGLSIVVPAVAGPYTLAGTTGHGTVVVRAAINVDPTDSHLTVTSDPLPTELDGIPLQLQVVNVTIDRPEFTFNPTSCSKMSIGASLTSTEGASAGVSSPFQVTNCVGLGFKPQFKVSTSGHTSRANGASLDAKVVYPLGPKLANIAKVKVELPKQLPSRLTTLQKACTDSVFSANPESCPAASRVGQARASTPILPGELTGAAYFVSHGGAAFPDLIVVLEDRRDGVRVDLTGSTFISKAGITSSTFKTVPDVPISSFELYLPQGPNSALAANGNLCSSSLKMPTEFVAQNGAVLHRAMPVAVTGCPKAAKARKARRARRARTAHRHHRHARHNGTYGKRRGQ
jgi:hypothetical protein